MFYLLLRYSSLLSESSICRGAFSSFWFSFGSLQSGRWFQSVTLGCRRLFDGLEGVFTWNRRRQIRPTNVIRKCRWEREPRIRWDITANDEGRTTLKKRTLRKTTYKYFFYTWSFWTTQNPKNSEMILLLNRLYKNLYLFNSRTNFNKSRSVWQSCQILLSSFTKVASLGQRNKTLFDVYL